MTRLRGAALLLPLCAALLGWAGPALAATDAGIAAALVVGINKYDRENALNGAVADADDIAGALRAAGVSDITVLRDGEATFKRIETAFAAMVERAGPGRRVLFSFSGHGAQEPEAIKGSEPDGKDEVLILAGFDMRTQAGARERIVDNELYAWLRRAEKKSVEVMLVIDSCHSGTITRGVDRRGRPGAVRVVPPYVVDPAMRVPFPEDGMDERDRPPANVIQLSAGQDTEIVPETPLPRTGTSTEKVPRGVLSYSFARALEGRADRNGDGVTTLAELRAYIRENVRQFADSRQTPNVLPDDGSLDTRGLFLSTGAAAASDAGQPRPAVVRMAALDAAGAEALRGALAGMAGVQVAASRAEADLVWDAARAEVVTGMGELAAQGVSADRLPLVVARWQAVEGLRRVADRRVLQARMTPGDGLHREGAEIALELSDTPERTLLLFDLTGDGTVQFLYPLDGDPPAIAAGAPFEVPFTVSPPYGADHLVAILTDRPRPRLNALVKELAEAGQAPATRISVEAAKAAPPAWRQLADLPARVAAELEGAAFQMVVQGFYTAPR